MRTITVAGSIHVDLVVRSERLPAPGETVIGGRFELLPGGKGANQAVAAAAAGARVRMVGCVGRDDHGRLALAALEGAGVDVSGVREVDAPTGVAVILVDARGENLISVASGAGEHVRLEGEHDLLLTQLETPWRRPRARTTILVPAPARAVPLAGVDWLLPNEHEARQLSGLEGLAAQRRALLAAGAARVVITCGARGVFDGELRAAFPVEAVDTTGAGDAFAGAFAAALAEEHPDPLRFAQAAAALKVTRPGAQSVARRAEIDAFLAERA